MNHVEVEEGDKKSFAVPTRPPTRAAASAATRNAQAGSASAELRDRHGPASGRARRRAGGPHGTHGGAGMGQGDEAGQLAGRTYQEGRLYYLFLKESLPPL